jgi:Ser/Thr protein kinase RdoA (MazF antagonist)
LARRLWWPELFWPRALAGELVGGEKLSLNTALQFDPVSRGASQKVSEVVGARSLGMSHLVVRSTCGGGRPKSSEADLTVPVGQGLGSSLGKLHDLSRKLSKGSGEVGGLQEWLATAVMPERWCLLLAASSSDLRLGRE